MVGVFFGVMSVFLFSGMTMNAVGRAAQKMVDEVRRQFKTIAGILEGKTEPDYARCVEISTKAAQREMMIPSLVALFIPVIVGTSGPSLNILIKLMVMASVVTVGIAVAYSIF